MRFSIPEGGVVISCLLAINACGGGGSESAPVPLVDSQNNLCSTLSAPSVVTESDFQIDFKLAGDSTLCLTGPARVRATVYAYDALVADVPATEMVVIDVPARTSGEVYSLRFDNSDLEQIEFQSGSQQALRYYYSVSVDTNGDSKICNGDLRQDFDLTAFMSYPVSTPKVATSVFMTGIDNRPCVD